MALMNRMRQNTKVILLILVFAFILTIIIDWGMGGFKGSRPQGIIAQIEGEDITYDQFYKSYQQELKAQRERTGIDPEGYQLQQIENQVFERLVQQILLTKIVNKLKFSATEDEIMSELWENPPAILRNDPSFQDSTGIFDVQKYQSILNNPEADQFWQSVIQYLRGTLPFQKLGNLINNSSFITDDDARLEYMKNNMKAKIDYIFYNASNYSQTVSDPDEQEIKAYYTQHKDDYKEEEKRVLDFVLFELKATKADSESIKRQARDLLDDAKSGRDFAQLAEIYSKDPGSAEKGGDLGYFKEGAMVKPFSDAAFAAKVGEIVGPVESQYGLHIIKVEDRRTVDGEQEVKARHILLKYEPSNTTRDRLREDAAYLAEYSKDSDLRQIAEAESLNVQTTQPFTAEGFIPGIGMENRVSRFAFRAKIGAVSEVLQIERGYLVVQVAQIIEAHVAPLEDVKTRIVNSINADKRMEAAHKAAALAYDKLASGVPLDEVAKSDSLEVQQSEEFVLGRSIPGIGRELVLAGKAMTLEIGEYSEPIKGNRGYYLIQLVDKKDFDEAEFQAQKENVRAQLAARQQNQLFSLWYTKLKEEAHIKDFRNEYF